MYVNRDLYLKYAKNSQLNNKRQRIEKQIDDLNEHFQEDIQMAKSTQKIYIGSHQQNVN